MSKKINSADATRIAELINYMDVAEMTSIGQCKDDEAKMVYYHRQVQAAESAIELAEVYGIEVAALNVHRDALAFNKASRSHYYAKVKGVAA